jgi:hypothetical protein
MTTTSTIFHTGGMMRHNHTERSIAYRIVLKESLDQDLINCYGDYNVITQSKGETVVIGKFTDQPALRGFLEQLWNLNITIITVERIDNES